MPRAGPKRVQRYSLDFKLNAVRLTEEEGVEVQAVAGALDIHPFMLSRWRKQVRDGALGAPLGRDGRPLPTPAARDDSLLREIKRLQQLEKEHKLLLEEHDLLKKAIRFWSELERKRSASSSGNAKRRR